MGWTAIIAASGQRVTPQDTKLCPLCGALNYKKNAECCLCGWGGVFEHQADQIQLAWQRLYDEFEEVRIEHVTAKRSPCTEGALARRQSRLLVARRRLAAWWHALWAKPAVASSTSEFPRTNTTIDGC